MVERRRGKCCVAWCALVTSEVVFRVPLMASRVRTIRKNTSCRRTIKLRAAREHLTNSRGGAFARAHAE